MCTRNVSNSARHSAQRQAKSRPWIPLQILAGMDTIADNAEDLGVLLTLRQMEVPPPWLKEPLEALRDKVGQVITESANVIDQVDALERERLVRVIDLVRSQPFVLLKAKVRDEHHDVDYGTKQGHVLAHDFSVLARSNAQ